MNIEQIMREAAAEDWWLDAVTRIARSLGYEDWNAITEMQKKLNSDLSDPLFWYKKLDQRRRLIYVRRLIDIIVMDRAHEIEFESYEYEKIRDSMVRVYRRTQAEGKSKEDSVWLMFSAVLMRGQRTWSQTDLDLFMDVMERVEELNMTEDVGK